MTCCPLSAFLLPTNRWQLSVFRSYSTTLAHTFLNLPLLVYPPSSSLFPLPLPLATCCPAASIQSPIWLSISRLSICFGRTEKDSQIDRLRRESERGQVDKIGKQNPKLWREQSKAKQIQVQIRTNPIFSQLRTQSADLSLSLSPSYSTNVRSCSTSNGIVMSYWKAACNKLYLDRATMSVCNFWQTPLITKTSIPVSHILSTQMRQLTWPTSLFFCSLKSSLVAVSHPTRN